MEFEQARWYNAEWVKEVHGCIGLHVGELGRELVGEITQPHVRAWATALRIPTSQGLLWFKATTSALPHESAITLALSGWTPGLTPHVVAADTRRNWLLMEHGGDRLRAYLQAGGDRGRVSKMAGEYPAMYNIPRVAGCGVFRRIRIAGGSGRTSAGSSRHASPVWYFLDAAE